MSKQPRKKQNTGSKLLCSFLTARWTRLKWCEMTGSYRVYHISCVGFCSCWFVSSTTRMPPDSFVVLSQFECGEKWEVVRINKCDTIVFQKLLFEF